MDGCRAKPLQFRTFRITCGGATMRERDGRVAIFIGRYRRWPSAEHVIETR